MAIIPKRPKKSKQGKREWFNKEKIKTPVKKELAEKTKKLIEKKSKSQMKQIVFSYMCPGCRSSFPAGSLQTRIIESARRGDSYISCPKCGVHLVADRTTKVSTKQNSKVNRNANLTITYPNQGINITPSYTPNSWIDRAILEKIAHELGKYCQKFGFFNPQLKFQRGIRGKGSTDALKNVKAAEFTVEAVDDYDLRFRVVAAAGITPAGKVVLPKFFMTLDGREIPFTKEAVAEFLSGKVFGSTDPTPVVPELYYKDRDPTRFREIVASRKKKAIGKPEEEEAFRSLPSEQKELAAAYSIAHTMYPGLKQEYGMENVEDMYNEVWKRMKQRMINEGLIPKAKNVRVPEGSESEANAMEVEEFKSVVKEYGLTPVQEAFLAGYADSRTIYFSDKNLNTLLEYPEYVLLPEKFKEDEGEKISKKEAAGTPTPGQTAEYQGKNYTIDSVIGDASVLTDEAGVQTAPISNAELNIQIEEGAVPPAPTLADRINKLVKRSLRDEKTLVPFTDPDPDYSVAKQTDVDADFSVPYKDSDQGILSEEERAVQKMFRGGSVIKPVKTAATVPYAHVSEMFFGDWGNGVLDTSLNMLESGKSSSEDVLNTWLDKNKFVLTDEEYGSLLKEFKDEWEVVMKEIKESSIKKTAAIDIGNRVRVPDGREGTVTAITPDYFDSEKGKEITVYTVAIDLGELEPFELHELTIISGVKERGYARKKTAEPTGYHETDDTGKVIELSRLRTLVQDYARAGQLPLDFDLTKVMSEVSRMTRKDLEDILDKKQKGQHYPVVHAKKKAFVGEMPIYHEGDEVVVEDERAPETPRKAKVNRVVDYNNATESYIYNVKYEDTEEDVDVYGFKLQSVPKEKISRNISQKINSKSTTQIVREIRKAELTVKDVKDDIKDEEEGEEHYKEQAKEVEDEKAKKFFEGAAKDEADHAEELEEVVLPAVKNTKNYLEKYDSKKKKAQDDYKYIPGDYHVGDTVYLVTYPKQPKGVVIDVTKREGIFAITDNYTVRLENGKEILGLGDLQLNLTPFEKEALVKKAQEEEVEEEEKPKTTLKELKTKPHGKPAPEEVAEAPAAAPELQTVFNEVKQHQQRLTEIKALINKARQKTEEEIRKIQEEQGSVAEAAEMQEGIEKLSSLIEQSESQIADLGEFFVWLDTESKTKKFKPSDKWRVQKLIEKFGKDAEEYLTKAEKGASSLNEEVQQRLLTVFPKLPKDKESSMKKKADVLDSIAELGSGLWSYVKEISGIISEGEQLELALE